jgi:hypothetical protein
VSTEPIEGSRYMNRAVVCGLPGIEPLFWLA